jgi:hypothetical protein
MTWEQWVNTDLNTLALVKDGTTIANAKGTKFVFNNRTSSYVTPTELIETNGQYVME